MLTKNKKILYSIVLAVFVTAFLFTNYRATLVEAETAQGAYYRGEYLFTTYYPAPYGAYQDISAKGNILFSPDKSLADGFPPSGTGTRLMWYPARAAFRAGVLNSHSNSNSTFSTAWDDANIGSGSVAMGFDTIASGPYSVSMGGYNVASGWYSTALGRMTQATAYHAVAMGYGTLAGGDASVAIGSSTTATGQASTAMGMSTIASGQFSTAMGQNSIASGNQTTAIGIFSQATNQSSIAIGTYAISSGSNSISIGQYTTAEGGLSIAIGNRLNVTGRSAIVLGEGDYYGTFTLANNITDSMMVGFNSDIPTLFVGPSSGIGTTGNVGIGITNPQRTLHIKDVMRLEPQSSAPVGAGKGDLYAGTDGNLYFYDGTSWKKVVLGP